MKKKVMVVFGLGGHAAQLVRLLKTMDLKKYDYTFVVGKGDRGAKKIVEKNLKGKGRIVEASTPRLTYRGKIVSTVLTLNSFALSVPLVLKYKPDVVISAGQALALPISVAAKLFGAKIVYLETWSRIRTKSLSGRYFSGSNPLRWKLADLFFVQWPEAKKMYPESVYVGRLG